MEEISGKWASSDGAILILKPNGTFSAEGFPDCIFNLSRDSVTRFGGYGVWDIKNTGSSWNRASWVVELDYKKQTNFKYGAEEHLLISGSGFTENAPPWNNLFIWKVEEGGDRYEFYKK